MHMVRDRIIASIVSPGRTRIVGGVDVVGGSVHQHRGEGWRKGANKQDHEQ
jgi:hypothetical protein